MVERKKALVNIVGKDNVFDDEELLNAYSEDNSFAKPMKPRFVVKAGNLAEVQSIVKLANEKNFPVIPVSSGPPHFRGDTVPGVGEAVVVDLSRMRKVIKIDRRNRMVIIEPGVTYSQLLPELAKEGLRLSIPLLPRGCKSVVTSLMEREPTLIPRYQYTLMEPLRSLEVVWGDGSQMWTGGAGEFDRQDLEEQWGGFRAQVLGMGPGNVDYYRLISASQGSMGIVTWASVKCEILPVVHKLFFVPAEKLEELIECVYKILRIRFGDEILLLNSANLASILGEKAEQITALRDKMPPWVFLVGIAGRDILAKERLEYQQKDISDIVQQCGLSPVSAIPGAQDGELLQVLSNPSREPYWKLRSKGGCQDIFFLTTLDKTPKFINTMYSVATELGYPCSEIGIYLQPQHQGVSCHCEFSLPYDPHDQKEVAKVQKLYTRASEEVMNQGAFFSRPYGVWADMVYDEDAQTTILLKKVKGLFDPNNVLNPGKLCF